MCLQYAIFVLALECGAIVLALECGATELDAILWLVAISLVAFLFTHTRHTDVHRCLHVFADNL
jgi:hypothetical protein